MNSTFQRLAFAAVVGLLVSMAYGLNYFALYDQNEDPFGSPHRLQSTDTLWGPLRFNERWSIMGEPVFYDHVISSADDFWRGVGYNPRFLGPAPTYDAPVLPIPTEATWQRARALEMDLYFAPGPDFYGQVRLEDSLLHVAWCRIGLPCSDPTFQSIPLPDTAVVFFDCALRLKGRVSTVLMLAASGDIGLEDNLTYASSVGIEARPPANHPEKLALISEGSIVVMNTVENGRENANGGGRNNPNQNQASIAINGLLFALGSSFTFENQNDADSGYVCVCSPDERGTVYLTGATVERWRGYLHRSTRGGTGYLRRFHYDEPLRHWNVHLFDARENEFTPASLDFGTIVADSAASRTVTFANDFVPLELENLHIGLPFMIAGLETGRNFEHNFEVWLVASTPGEYFDTLRIQDEYYAQEFLLPVHGVVEILAADVTPELPREFSLSVYPNPFNAEASLRYALAQAGRVRLSLFDVGGREVATLVDEPRAAGDHVARLVGTELATGVYFAVLRTGAEILTEKVLLLK